MFALCHNTCTIQTNWNIFPLQIGKVCSKLINSYLHCDKCGRFNNSLTRKVLCQSHKWNTLYMLPHYIPTTYINTVKIQPSIITSILRYGNWCEYHNQELEVFKSNAYPNHHQISFLKYVNVQRIECKDLFFFSEIMNFYPNNSWPRNTKWVLFYSHNQGKF